MSFGGAVAEACAVQVMKVIFLVAIAATVVGATTGVLIGRATAPVSAYEEARQQDRRLIIERLSPRERKILGLELLE